MNNEFIKIDNLKILYLHGYNSDLNSTTSNLLESALTNLLGTTFEYYSPTIDNDPVVSIKYIEEYVRDNNINVVIGSSLGGFKVLHANLLGIRKVVINPLICVNTLKGDILDEDTYGKCLMIYNSKEKVKDDNLIGIFSENDEIINTKLSVQLFQTYCSNPSGVTYINDVHTPLDSTERIASIIVLFLMRGEVD